MTFASRIDAGQQLAIFLRDAQVQVDIVLGLPRGGVVVAEEIARTLHKPLDVLIVRKIGHPMNREFAIGAIAEPDVAVLDNDSLRQLPAGLHELESIVEEEKLRLAEYQSLFHHGRRPELSGNRVLLVDDGIATGATTEVAVLSAKKQGAAHVIVTAPVASLEAVKRLRRSADAVMVPHVESDFGAVGHYYIEFSQTSDEEVVQLLEHAQHA